MMTYSEEQLIHKKNIRVKSTIIASVITAVVIYFVIKYDATIHLPNMIYYGEPFYRTQVFLYFIPVATLVVSRWAFKKILVNIALSTQTLEFNKQEKDSAIRDIGSDLNALQLLVDDVSNEFEKRYGEQ